MGPMEKADEDASTGAPLRHHGSLPTRRNANRPSKSGLALSALHVRIGNVADVPVGDVGEGTVVGEGAVVGEGVVGDFVTPVGEIAPRYSQRRNAVRVATSAVRDGRRVPTSGNGTVKTAQLPLLSKRLLITVSLRPPEITSPVPGEPRSALPCRGTLALLLSCT